MARTKYKLIDVGRNKFNGVIEAQSEHAEHVEAAILRQARNHLMSCQVHVVGDTVEGTIYAGLRPVGTYKRMKS